MSNCSCDECTGRNVDDDSGPCQLNAAANWREPVRRLTERVLRLESTIARHQELLLRCEPHMPDPDDAEPSRRDRLEELYRAAQAWAQSPGLTLLASTETEALLQALYAVEPEQAPAPDERRARWSEPAGDCEDCETGCAGPGRIAQLREELDELRLRHERRHSRVADALESLRETFTLRPDCCMIDDAVEDACAEMRTLRELCDKMPLQEPGRVSISREQWQTLVDWAVRAGAMGWARRSHGYQRAALDVCRQLRDMPPPEPSLEELLQRVPEHYDLGIDTWTSDMWRATSSGDYDTEVFRKTRSDAFRALLLRLVADECPVCGCPDGSCTCPDEPLRGAGP